MRFLRDLSSLNASHAREPPSQRGWLASYYVKTPRAQLTEVTADIYSHSATKDEEAAVGLWNTLMSDQALD